MHVGTLRVYFQVLSARSLKEKRQVLRSAKDRLQSRFNISVAEIGSQDLWNAGELGVAMVGTDHRYVNGAMEKVLAFLEANPAIRIIEHDIEII
jgi:uncharacterized protein YlxP (DUF503 family)